jgi:hypothetical protein
VIYGRIRLTVTSANFKTDFSDLLERPMPGVSKALWKSSKMTAAWLRHAEKRVPCLTDPVGLMQTHSPELRQAIFPTPNHLRSYLCWYSATGFAWSNFQLGRHLNDFNSADKSVRAQVKAASYVGSMFQENFMDLFDAKAADLEFRRVRSYGDPAWPPWALVRYVNVLRSHEELRELWPREQKREDRRATNSLLNRLRRYNNHKMLLAIQSLSVDYGIQQFDPFAMSESDLVKN